MTVGKVVCLLDLPNTAGKFASGRRVNVICGFLCLLMVRAEGTSKQTQEVQGKKPGEDGCQNLH